MLELEPRLRLCFCRCFVLEPRTRARYARQECRSHNVREHLCCRSYLLLEYIIEELFRNDDVLCCYLLFSFGSEFLEFRVVTRRGGKIRRASLSGVRGHNHSGGAGDVNGSVGGNDGRRNIGSSAGGGESFAVVWRRFTAFRQLHYDITAVLRGSHHMIESLPPLPGNVGCCCR